MAVAMWDSNDARIKWREVVDTAAKIGDVVITRYGTPVVAMIDYADWMALQDALEDLRAGRQADAAYQEWKLDPSTARPWKEIRAELVAEGLLDDAV